ncbi:hypothetical protein MTR67_049192 [Solanum verrucosum]|uniref:Uncharacterized protein n=1 Tax=Solanum verrucosum TaxID=315347 RepID=A0AAF0UZY7_SOLVR|nr:hypothetical protein MTR67_049192 [Solanum verrucosum]
MRTATASYWLTWNFLFLGLGVLVLVGIAALIIWKYEGSPKLGIQERDSKKKKVGFLYKDEAWTTCHKSIHPAWLLAYRLIAFTFLLSMLSSDAYLNSTDIFFFYTQWTFSLVTIYFGLGSSLSIYGCIQYRKGVTCAKVCCIDEERNDSPTLEKNASLPGVSKDLSSIEETDVREPAGYLGYVFQIIFQACLCWCRGAYGLRLLASYLPVFLAQWFRIAISSYWYAFYQCYYPAWRCDSEFSTVPFLQICIFCSLYVHICLIPVARPYVCLKVVALSLPGYFIQIRSLSAARYLMVGVVHLPCYGMFALVIALKYWLARLFKWMIRKLSGDKQ